MTKNYLQSVQWQDIIISISKLEQKSLPRSFLWESLNFIFILPSWILKEQQHNISYTFFRIKKILPKIHNLIFLLNYFRVVSGSRDATLRMWDIDSGECLHVLMGHVAAVRCVQYDGRLVVSGAYDYMVKVWNPETEECIHTLSGHTNRVYSLQFDGIHVVSGSLDTSIRVWDVETGACKHALMGHQSLTSGMELRNNILVSGNADSTVKVWDITTGQCLQTLTGTNI